MNSTLGMSQISEDGIFHRFISAHAGGEDAEPGHHGPLESVHDDIVIREQFVVLIAAPLVPL